MKVKIVGIIIFLNFLVLSVFAQAIIPEGSGTNADPYQVASLENLLWISDNSSSWNSYFIQIADIDASDTQNWNNGAGWSPIGYWHSEEDYERFTGYYDGDNHKIIGLYINRPNTENVGFFGEFSSAGVENLGLENVNITAKGYSGSLVGYSTECEITNCYARGSITAEYWVGGLIGGSVGNSSVTKSFADVAVTATGEYGSYVRAGGFMGVNRDSAILNCYALGDVTSEIDGLVGGFIGYNAKVVSEMNDAIIENCYSIGKVIVENNYLVGGFVGENHYNAIINNSYWDVEASEYSTSDGGEGRTTEEMTFPSSNNCYVNWDFTDTWSEDIELSNAGYPYLQSDNSVANDNTDVLNLSYNLTNYPNPFNPETTISFNMPQAGKANVQIYNLRGQLVKTLLNDQVSVGIKNVVWNGTDAQNRPVASGLYFYRVKTDKNTIQRKMLLQK